MQVLDSSIANVSIPYIAGNLGVSVDEGTWVITSFAVSNAIVLPLTGWLSNYFGSIRLFVSSVLLFTLFSFLCGLCRNLTLLVICRVMQGGVAGSLIPLSQSILVSISPHEKRGAVLGLWGAIVIIAPLLGPVLGGYFTEAYSWPWIFYINVPVGLASASITWFLLKDRETPIIRNPIDWVGISLLSLSVASIQIMLDKGLDLDWFESDIIVTLGLVSAISFIYFVIWNWFAKYPVVDFSIFRSRNFTLGTFLLSVGYMISFAGSLTLPLWLQTQQGYTAFWAGLAIAPVGIIPFLTARIIGSNLYRFDVRKVISLGFIFLSAVFFLQSYFTTQISLEKIMFNRFLQGISNSIFFLPMVQLALSEVKPGKYASASGVLNFIRILVAGGFGTALSIELWTRLAIFHHARLSDAMNDGNGVMESLRTSLSSEVSNEVFVRLMDRSVEQQAYMLSTNDLSFMAACLILGLAPIAFLFHRTKSPKDKHVSAEG